MPLCAVRSARQILRSGLFIIQSAGASRTLATAARLCELSGGPLAVLAVAPSREDAETRCAGALSWLRSRHRQARTLLLPGASAASLRARLRSEPHGLLVASAASPLLAGPEIHRLLDEVAWPVLLLR